jgi:hypothetical protein
MNDHELDRLLDKSLSECANTSPRGGLEERILANLAESPKRRSWMWLWITAPVTAVIIFAALMLFRTDNKTSTVQVAIIASPVTNPTVPQLKTPPPPVTSNQPHPKRVRPRRKPVTAEGTREPMLAQFPSPVAPDEARLLLQFVHQHPDTAQAVLREQQEFRAMIARSHNNQLQIRSEEP